jgi:serine/threonine-protein kinase RsbW
MSIYDPDMTDARNDDLASPEPDTVTIEFLSADDAGILVGLVSEVYGDTYDADWVYNREEIARRISEGTLVSTVGRNADGTVIGHLALMVEHGITSVVHAGVAVVTKSARGHHLFTRMKQFGAKWATSAGYFGVFSEATAAHPYSQKANVDLGAAETGFLLGWIPNSVANSVVVGRETHRESVALFYLSTNNGPDRPIYAPARYRAVINDIIAATGIHGHIAIAPPNTVIPEHSVVTVQTKEDHNLAIINVVTPGADILEVLTSTRDRLVIDDGRDAVYVDFPLELPATELVLDACDETLKMGFAGVFPNHHVGGDALRLQSLHTVSIHGSDIATASAHGEQLLAYVLAELERTHANY